MIDTEKQRARWRRSHLQKRNGISPTEFERMLAVQGGVCAICKRPERTEYKRRLSVDHDHSTGRIRGLLCHHCNTAIGKLDDSPELLESAAEYLRASGEDN